MSDNTEVEQNNKFWYLLAILIVALLGFLISKTVVEKVSNNAEEIVIDQSVNTAAKLTPTGDPLPSAVTQDVEVELSTLIGATSAVSKAIVRQDGDNGAWEIETIEDGEKILLRFVEGTYYLTDDTRLVWTIVPESFAEDVANGDSFLFKDADITNFLSTSIRLPDEDCREETDAPSVTCTVWESENLDGDELIQFRINKQTRKIDKVIAANTTNDTSIVATYTYYSIELTAPEEGSRSEF